MSVNTTAPRSHALDGTATVRIPLSNRQGQFALLDAADWEQWLALGRSPNLFVVGNGAGREYVAFYDPQVPGECGTVARRLLGLGKGRVVRFANGVTGDLRRVNLLAVDGKAGGRKRASSRPQQRLA